MYRKPIKVNSEIGIEKQCFTCGQFWPADDEFFGTQIRSADGLTPRCLACIKERCWTPLGGISARLGFES